MPVIYIDPPRSLTFLKYSLKNLDEVMARNAETMARHPDEQHWKDYAAEMAADRVLLVEEIQSHQGKEFKDYL